MSQSSKNSILKFQHWCPLAVKQYVIILLVNSDVKRGFIFRLHCVEIIIEITFTFTGLLLFDPVSKCVKKYVKKTVKLWKPPAVFWVNLKSFWIQFWKAIIMGNSELLGTRKAEEQAPDNQENQNTPLF